MRHPARAGRAPAARRVVRRRSLLPDALPHASGRAPLSEPHGSDPLRRHARLPPERADGRCRATGVDTRRSRRGPHHSRSRRDPRGPRPHSEADAEVDGRSRGASVGSRGGRVNPIRLMFVLTSPTRGGVEEVVLALLKRLSPAEFRLALAAPRALLEAFGRDLDGVPVDIEPVAAESWWRRTEVSQRARFSHRVRPDIVNPHLFRSVVVAAPLARWHRVSGAATTTDRKRCGFTMSGRT